MGTYMGLAVPIFGGYTTRCADGTTVVGVVDNYGFRYIDLAYNAACAASGNYATRGFVEGFSVYVTVTTTNTASIDGACFSVKHTSGTSTGQIWAAEFWLEGAASQSMAGGRVGCIQLVLNHPSTYTWVNEAVSFINFYALDKQPYACMTFLGATVDSSYFVAMAESAAASHGLRIYVDNVAYYIMLHATTAA